MTIEEILDVYDRSGYHGEWEKVDAVFEAFIALRAEMAKVRVIIQEWLDQQGHDRCWYYPELFDRLVQELGLTSTRAPGLPSREEFERSCRCYADEQYGMSRTRDEHGKVVRDAYRSALFYLCKVSSKVPEWNRDENEFGKELDRLIGDILFDGRVL